MHPQRHPAAVQAGLQSGDFHYAAFAACQSVAGRICMGDEVRGCLEQTEQMHELLQGWLGHWLQGLEARAHANVASVALAAKLARFCWAIMARNDHYRAPT